MTEGKQRQHRRCLPKVRLGTIGGNVDTGLAQEYTYEDWRFWMRLAALGARIANIEQPLFHYRRHGVAQHQQPIRLSRRHGRAAGVDLSITTRTCSPRRPTARSRRRKETEFEVANGTVNLVPIDTESSA